ncbi:MAG: sulfotransferase domain-containing protein [Vicinamibacterales bacterium]
MTSRDDRPAARPLPDCLVIGAAKAGTTSLFNILGRHPQVAASREKETRFFSHDARFARGMAWYAAHFFPGAPGTAVRLDASPAYLTWSDKVAPRVRDTHGDHVAIVAILRDPVARAYSHYWHRVRLGHERLSFAEAIAREDERLRARWDELSRTGNGLHGYLRASAYASRLQPFLDRFDRSRFHFLLQEDLRPESFHESMATLARFLQVDDRIPLQPARVNAPVEARSRRLARAYLLLKRTSMQRLYTTMVPPRIRRALLSVLFTDTTYPPIDPEIEQQLRVRLADEVGRCQDIIGRDLSRWLPA